ncbi:MAG: DUF4249 family protein, partial [FCB group bacterium]|nr:DUF4249 family protein [FCB group bacterium]
GLFLTSCELTNPAVTYEQKLVVFGNLTADFPMVDTLFVSRSAAIGENLDSYALYIDDAEITITDGDTTIPVPPVPDRPGRYLADPDYIFRAGKEYRVKVVWEDDTVTAKTVLPEKMEFSSEGSDSYTCNGSPVTIAPITVDNATLQLYDGQLIPVPTGPIDTVVYRTGDCYTESFASLPYFFLNFNADDYHTVRIISFALEAETRGPEPFDDRNGNGVWDADSEPFVDYNRDGVRDSTFINLIYDTTFTSIAWKGDYLRTEQNDPYRYNPVVWAVDTSPLPMTWLYFNYYGFHLIALQATDQAYYDYFSGDPFGMNQYLLPDSNIEGGYGLFSSTYTKFFFVYIKPE